MKRLKSVLLAIFVILLLEGSIRLSRVYQTYAEANFNRYESAYDQKRSSDYFLERKDTIRYTQSEFNYSCQTNALGLRDEKPFQAPSDKSYRLLFLGDSFTEGVGATCGNNMPAVFQSYVPDSITVYNAGVVGADPFLYLSWYDKYFSVIAPTEVVIVLNNSDISDYIFRGGDERFIKNSNTFETKVGPSFSTLYRHSHLVRFVLHFVLRYDFTLLSPNQFENESELAIKAMAKKINNWKSKHPEFKLSVVLQPYAFAVKKHVPGHDKLPKISAYLNDDIQLINLYPRMNQIFNESNYLDYSWKLDGHFNDAGYQLFAQELYEAWK